MVIISKHYQLTQSNHMKNKKLLIPIAALALIGGAFTGLAVSASAQTVPSGTATTANTATKAPNGHGVAGTIASINGDTITLTGKDGKTYTVDAGSATISKISTINVSGLTVGDTLMVGGTVNGTSVTATHIMSGTMPTGGFAGRVAGGVRGKGNGVMGTVSAVNGTSLTVTNKAGTAYTVDASNAKVSKSVSGSAPTTITVSNIAIGDTVSVRGKLSGTSVVATQIFDGIHQARAPNSSGTTTK